MNTLPNEDMRTVYKDEILFREGETPTDLVLVKTGSILCVKWSKERLVPVFWGTAQKVIGEEAILCEGTHAYTAIAMEESQVILISRELISKVMAGAPNWISGLLGALGLRSTDTASAIAEHRLIHSELAGGEELSAQEETRLKKLLS